MARRSPKAPRRRWRETPGSSRRTSGPRPSAMPAESGARRERHPDDAAPVRPEGGATAAPSGLPASGAAPAPPMLDVRNLRAGYRDIPVLRGVSLAVGPAQIVALVGANGAGKTTLLRAIAGLLAPGGGELHFGGARIDGVAPHAVVAR